LYIFIAARKLVNEEKTSNIIETLSYFRGQIIMVIICLLYMYK
jgi:hypothetical protein